MNYAEVNCTIEHQGRIYTSGGAVITDSRCVGYVRQPVGEPKEVLGHTYVLTNWRGLEIGTIWFTSRWQTPGSFISTTMYQAIATVHGVRHTGRTRGFGMAFSGKRVAKQWK